MNTTENRQLNPEDHPAISFLGEFDPNQLPPHLLLPENPVSNVGPIQKIQEIGRKALNLFGKNGTST